MPDTKFEYFVWDPEAHPEGPPIQPGDVVALPYADHIEIFVAPDLGSRFAQVHWERLEDHYRGAWRFRTEGSMAAVEAVFAGLGGSRFKLSPLPDPNERTRIIERGRQAVAEVEGWLREREEKKRAKRHRRSDAPSDLSELSKLPLFPEDHPRDLATIGMGKASE